MIQRRVMIDATFAITFDGSPDDDNALVAHITEQLRRLPEIITEAEVDPTSIHAFIAGPGSPEDPTGSPQN